MQSDTAQLVGDYKKQDLLRQINPSCARVQFSCPSMHGMMVAFDAPLVWWALQGGPYPSFWECYTAGDPARVPDGKRWSKDPDGEFPDFVSKAISSRFVRRHWVCK